MTRPPPPEILYAKIRIERFTPEDEAKLVKSLGASDRSIVVKPVRDTKEMLLDGKGYVQGNLRYSAAALRQISTELAPGLYRVLCDVSGMHRSSDKPRGDYSFAAAVDIFNSLLRVRFRSRFMDRARLVINKRDRIIEGILGPQYQFLGNLDIFEMAKQVAQSGLPCQLHEAVLIGRRLLLRFKHKAPLFKTELDGVEESFFSGYHFSNSEIAGEASVRASLVLIQGSNGTASLARPPGSRLAHAGKSFDEKVRGMFSRVLVSQQNGPQLRAKMEKLATTPLIPETDPKGREDRLHYLELALRGVKLPSSLAKHVLGDALYRGVHNDRFRPTPRTGRNYYHLYGALTKIATKLEVTSRELTEHAAYLLLQGRLLRSLRDTKSAKPS